MTEQIEPMTKEDALAHVAHYAVLHWFAAPGSPAPHIYRVRAWAVRDDGSDWQPAEPNWWIGIDDPSDQLEEMGYHLFDDGQIERDPSDSGPEQPADDECMIFDFTIPLLEAALQEQIRFYSWCARGKQPGEEAYRAECAAKAEALQFALNLLRGESSSVTYMS
ncbi:MAG TPA: hypothetical protein VFZ66_29830 [Herpetosiphonaceae bacterium]